MDRIERIDAPSPEYFRENYLEPGRPVVLRGISKHWPASTKWSDDYLVDLVGDRTVNATRMINGNYVDSTNIDLSLREYVDALKSASETDERLYLAELPIEEYLPELLDDIVIPTYFDKTESSPRCFLYMGQSVFSQMHYHIFGSALLSPIRGYKKVRLVAPDQTRYLYKYPWYSENGNMSRTTSLEPDPNTFPDFSKARFIDLELKAGESLFIPIYWWHAITNEAFNVAVVIFWYEKMFNRLPPRDLAMDYLYDLFKESPANAAGIYRKLKSMVLRRDKREGQLGG